MDRGSFIDMPSLMGAIHIEHCSEELMCHVPVSNAYTESHYSAGGNSDDLLSIFNIFSSKH